MRRGFHGDARRQRPGVRAPGRRAVLFGTAPAGQPASQQTPGVLRGSPEPCGRLGECAGTPRCKRCSRRSTLAPRPLPPHILPGLGDRAGPAGRPAQVAGSRTDFLPQNDLNGLALPTCLGRWGWRLHKKTRVTRSLLTHPPGRRPAPGRPPEAAGLSAQTRTHALTLTLTLTHSHVLTLTHALTRTRMLTLIGAHVHTHTHTLILARAQTHALAHMHIRPLPRAVFAAHCHTLVP